MKSIPQLTKSQQKSVEVRLESLAVELAEEKFKQMCDVWDIVTIYVLNKYFKFKEKDIYNFYYKLFKEKTELFNWYSSEDKDSVFNIGIDSFVMLQELKDKNIDVRKIIDKAYSDFTEGGNKVEES